MTLTISSVIKKILLLFLIVIGLVYAKVFLMPLTIGGILATLFLPFCHWLEGKKLPIGIAVFLCFLLLMFILAILISLLGWKVVELTNDVTVLKQNGIIKNLAIRPFNIHSEGFKTLAMDIERLFVFRISLCAK